MKMRETRPDPDFPETRPDPDFPEQNYDKTTVESCIELIDMQIDIESSSGSIVKGFLGIVLAVSAGILTAVWKKVAIEDLILIGLSFAAFAAVIAIALSLFPSKEERLKEMKYFVKLFCREEDGRVIQ